MDKNSFFALYITKAYEMKLKYFIFILTLFI